jgi:phosphoribosyl-ATP pyrophosphohydrolase
MSDALERLYRTIESRMGANPDSSWTAKLLAGGTPAITAKVAEEAAETVKAALSEGKPRVIAESADLLYHLLVLWADQRVQPDEVWAELQRREGVSGIEEKRRR